LKKCGVILSAQAQEVAEQLNLWNFELFKQIEAVEYVNNMVSKDTALFPNLDNFIKRFELVNLLVISFFDCARRDFLVGKLLGCNRGLSGEGAPKENTDCYSFDPNCKGGIHWPRNFERLHNFNQTSQAHPFPLVLP